MPTMTPLLDAPIVIQLHVVAACLAIVVGPMAMLRRSRDIWHKRLGRVWVLVMAATALSSLAINESRMLGPFSVIHLLSILTLVGLWNLVAFARTGRIVEHRKQALALYAFGLGIPGLFTLLPGRRMGEVFFASAPWTGFWVTSGGLAVAFVLVIIRVRRNPGNSSRHLSS